ncbi:MAG TPA: GNAT family protein [Pseudonocardiaceae bacterium]
MGTEYVRLAAGDGPALADFLAADDWPFHAGGRPDRAAVLARFAAGYYDGPTARTFWVTADGRRVGLLRLGDLDDLPGGSPVFDLRIAAAERGRGHGRRAVEWLTDHVFTEFPDALRLEATTRADNAAMRATFRAARFVREAYYRDGWPGGDGTVHDAVGYAILRRDWASGTTTPVPREQPESGENRAPGDD